MELPVETVWNVDAAGSFYNCMINSMARFADYGRFIHNRTGTVLPGRESFEAMP